MEFGVGLLNHPGCWDDLAFAEQHGFTSAGFVDTPLLSGDPFVCMALTAQATSKMKVGTFLNVPSVRSAPATAAALSMVNRIAPGRVFFGTGTGYTGRLTFGLPPMGIDKVRDHMDELRGLLEGRDVTHRHAGRETLIRVANEELIRNNAENPIPMYMAADGPAALKTTGAAADGWITTLHPGASTMDTAPEVFATRFQAVRDSAAQQGRNLDDAYTMWSTSMCVLEPGESAISPRALAQTGPMAMFSFHSYACNPAIGEFLPPEMRERLDIYEKKVLARLDIPRERFYQEVHAGHLSHLIDGEAAVLTEEIIRMMSLTGTPEEIAGQLQRLDAAGLKNVSLTIPPGCFRDVVVDVETKIMPLLA